MRVEIRSRCIHEDGQKFVTVILGFLLMTEDELGYDSTISTCKDGQRYISVVQGGNVQGGNEKRFLIERLILRQPSIVGRGTTCWKARLEGSDKRFVMKDSWQYEGRVDEGTLLTECTPSPYVASW